MVQNIPLHCFCRCLFAAIVVATELLVLGLILRSRNGKVGGGTGGIGKVEIRVRAKIKRKRTAVTRAGKGKGKAKYDRLSPLERRQHCTTTGKTDGRFQTEACTLRRVWFGAALALIIFVNTSRIIN